MPPVIAAAVSTGAALFGASVPLQATLAAFAAANSGLIITGALIGAQYGLQRALAPKPSAGNTPETKGTFRQAIPAERVIYGTQRVGGAVFFLDDSSPPWLYLGLLLSSRPVTRILGVTVGEQAVTLDATTYAATTTPFQSGGTYLYGSFRFGDPDQTIDPILDADFASLDSSFRQRGIATAVFKSHWGADFDHHQSLWGNVQVPNYLIELEGAPVYNPLDPTQIVDEPESWRFDNTAALVQADYLRSDYGGRAAHTQIDWDEVARSAEYDAELVGLAGGGFQKRHTIDAVISKARSPADVLSAAMTANRGFLVQSNGRMWVTSSRPRDPVFAIGDADLAGGFEYRAGTPKREMLNRVRVRFPSPERNYDIVDGPVLDREDLQLLDGELLEASLELPFSATHPRAQRLSAGVLAESRIGRRITCPVPTRRALGLKPGHAVTVASILFPEMNGSYQVEQRGFSGDFSTMPLVLAEYDGSTDAAWNPSTDEQSFELADLDVS